MSVHFVAGRLGSGKTLFTVGVMRDALLRHRRVATNINLDLSLLLPRMSRAIVTRLPDKPRVQDLQALGYGCEARDYSGKRFGVLVLDELGTWFNSRNWNDKERLPVIDWFLHARKFRWDVYLIVQDISLVDSQLRDALCEFNVQVRAVHTVPIPLLGSVLRLFGVRVKLPQASVATFRYGQATTGLHHDRRWYRARDLFTAYDTGQVFQSGLEMVGDDMRDMRAVSTVLSPWHIAGRYYVRPQPLPWLTVLLLLPLLPGVLFWATVRGVAPLTVGQNWGLWEVRKSGKSRLPGP